MPGPGEYRPDPTEGITSIADLPKPKVRCLSRNYRRRPCLLCGHSAYRDRLVRRSLHDLGNPLTGRPCDRIVIYSQHYCTRCRKYFNADMTDLASPGSHYTRRVVDTAVRLVVEDGLPYRTASWSLWRDHRVFVPYATIQNFEVALFSTCVSSKEGASSFLRIWAKWWLRRGPRQTLRKEPPVLIMQDALPLFKSFLEPVSLKQRARQLVVRCVIAFLMHLGKMSASRAAGAVRTDARHRAQVSRFMARGYWRRCDLLGQLRAQLLEMEARQGTFIFDIDQTYCSQQGKLTENTIIRGEKTKRPKKSKKKQKKYAQRSSHCFVMGLLITPSGMRLPFSVSYY